jgi:hypothetical protein
MVGDERKCGLYTPRSLIRKCKVYTTAELKRNYEGSVLRRPAAKSSYRKGKMPFARNSEIAGNGNHLRVEILVVVLALRRELQILVPGLGVLENFPFVFRITIFSLS